MMVNTGPEFLEENLLFKNTFLNFLERDQHLIRLSVMKQRTASSGGLVSVGSLLFVDSALPLHLLESQNTMETDDWPRGANLQASVEVGCLFCTDKSHWKIM